MPYPIDISFFEHENMKGVEYPVQASDAEYKWQQNLHNKGWGDVISSVEVRGGWVALYEDVDFNGSIRKLGPGTSLPKLAGINWNDVASSYIACSHDFDPVEAAQKYRR